MAIDRNLRTRLAIAIRQSRDLTPTAKLVANASLFSAMDSRTGRSQAYRAKLAHECGCSVKSVSRASKSLEEAGLVQITPTYGKKRVFDNGRTYRPRAANVWIWRDIKQEPILGDKKSLYPSVINTKEAGKAAQMPPELAAALARLVNAAADRRERDAVDSSRRM